ncbi:MAG: site-specific integrase [Bacteroidetes bacterium]|nr:site-specific integrase [Bacteroidota bacterium]
MQTRFYIERRKDGNGNLLLRDRPVFMSVSFPGDRIMLSTGVKTDFHYWDPEQQRVKSSFPGSLATNSWLETLSVTAHMTWGELNSGSGKPDGERFRSLFRELKPKYSTGFFDVFFLFLESGISRWNTATYRKVRTIYKHMREFEKATSYGLSFRNMNVEFLDKFTVFYSEKGNNPATTHKAINIVVWFMNWATEKGYNVSRDYRKFYKALDKSVESTSRTLFLKWDELIRLLDLDCDNKRKERVRDLFCFICFTGLRYSELQSLRKEDVLNGEVIVRKKGGKQRRVPMNVQALEIHSGYANKYYLNNTAFPTISIITMNKYLRKLGEEAGLDRLVDPVTGSDALRPLYSRLTAGMGVHTFLANAIELDVPYEIISGFTGVRADKRLKEIKSELQKKQLEKLSPP